MFTGIGVNVYWYWSQCLLVLESMFTGIGVNVYWYWSQCLLVLESMFTGIGVNVYWYWSQCLLVLESMFTDSTCCFSGSVPRTESSTSQIIIIKRPYHVLGPPL